MSKFHSQPQPAVHPSALGPLVPHPTYTLRLVSAVARRIHHPWFQGKRAERLAALREALAAGDNAGLLELQAQAPELRARPA